MLKTMVKFIFEKTRFKKVRAKLEFKVVICLFFNVLIKCLVFFKAEFCAENDGEIYFWKKQGLKKLEPKVEN